jgi:hypothetical protein
MKLSKLTSTPIILKKLDGKWWSLDEPLIIFMEIEEAGVVKIRLDKGFKTDFGSIPKFAQGYINRADDNLLAFIMHDAGYCIGGFTRDTWDRFLYQGLRMAGMGWFKAQAVYQSVSWFGEDYFDIATDEQAMRAHMTWDDK